MTTPRDRLDKIKAEHYEGNGRLAGRCHYDHSEWPCEVGHVVAFTEAVLDYTEGCDNVGRTVGTLHQAATETHRIIARELRDLAQQHLGGSDV